MKAPAFGYVAPTSLDEAFHLLHHADNARILAGGQSLVAMLNMRFAHPDCLIDISRVPGLASIEDRGDSIHIGSMTRQRDVEFSALVQARLPLLHEAILNVGHRQTRNRGTVGGSLCHLDPSAEIPTVAMAMDACIHVGSINGRREIAMADFPAGYMTPAIDADEMVLGISIQPWDATHGSSFIEYARRHGDYAIVSSAVLAQFGQDGRISRCSITLGGCTTAPVRMPKAENLMIGSGGDASTIEQAAALCSEVEASTDAYVTAWYRQRLARSLTQRALTTAIQRATR